MSHKKKQRNRRLLKDKIEIITSESGSSKEYDSNPEDFVVPLLEKVRDSLKLEKFDLTSADSAQAADKTLEQKLELIRTRQRQVRGLKQTLEQKRFELETAEDPPQD